MMPQRSRTRSLPRRIAVITIVASVALLASCNENPRECQRLRQCCDFARASGYDIEPVRVQCTRKDDDQATLCARRLDEVRAALPKLEDQEECRLAR